MALDTRDKRASALGRPCVVFPNPDGVAFDAPDRQHIMGMYRGITANVVVPYVFAGTPTGIGSFVYTGTGSFRYGGTGG